MPGRLKVAALKLFQPTSLCPALGSILKRDCMGYKIRVELKKVGTATEIILSEPKETGSPSIEETLSKRRSVRDYKKGPLRLEQISQALWAASGRNLYRRTVPSTGATYPFETSLVVGEAVGKM